MKAETQRTLIEVKPPRKPVAVTQDEIESMIRHLRTSNGGGWTTASRIETATGIGDRKMRAIANESKGRIISGQRGYRLTAKANMDEIARASAWLRHQGCEMISRAMEIDRVYYGRGKKK